MKKYHYLDFNNKYNKVMNIRYENCYNPDYDIYLHNLCYNYKYVTNVNNTNVTILIFLIN